MIYPRKDFYYPLVVVVEWSTTACTTYFRYTHYSCHLIPYPIPDGFHKITSLDTGGLKFDRDDMEFSHPCFQRGHPFLLENIKRKIAHARNQPEEKTVATTSAAHPPEALNRVLTEVKMMRGKQEVLDNRFQSMKQENEALWREVVMLRQKHMKQQQIVNKVRNI